MNKCQFEPMDLKITQSNQLQNNWTRAFFVKVDARRHNPGGIHYNKKAQVQIIWNWWFWVGPLAQVDQLFTLFIM